MNLLLEDTIDLSKAIMRELAFRRGFDMGLIVGLILGVMATAIISAVFLRWALACMMPRKEKEK